ncbi:hypothetical protein M7784_08205 [Desulfovibrio aminophilus]|nr:hypothetical protein [Desulfovibrio aminophilus]MCM0755229.1 hypothetical protein [Desulfovibrio aminophilus]
MFLKLLLGFAPWLAFLFIAHGSLFRLKLGLITAFALTVIMGVLRLHRGVILWMGLLFFGYALVAVLVFENMWTVRFMGVLANAALGLGVWITLGMGKPFTLDYARGHTDPSLWNDPVFLRTSTRIAIVWGLVFTVNAGIALNKALAPVMPDLAYEFLTYAVLLGTLVFTTWYPKAVRRRQAALRRSAS